MAVRWRRACREWWRELLFCLFPSTHNRAWWATLFECVFRLPPAGSGATTDLLRSADRHPSHKHTLISWTRAEKPTSAWYTKCPLLYPRTLVRKSFFLFFRGQREQALCFVFSCAYCFHFIYCPVFCFVVSSPLSRMYDDRLRSSGRKWFNSWYAFGQVLI